MTTHLNRVFESLLSEVLEYRLQRYLKSKDLPEGAAFQVVDEKGTSIDAHFSCHSFLGQPTGLLIKSAGAELNTQYVAGLDILLERLSRIDASITDAYVDSGVVRNLPISARRLGLSQGLSYPIELSSVVDLAVLRKSLLNTMKSIGRSPTAKSSGGNSRKAMTLLVGNIQQYPIDDLSQYLIGTGPPPHSNSANLGVA